MRAALRVACAVLPVCALSAQPPQPRMEKVADNVYALRGLGATLGVVVTPQGVVLIDAPSARRLPLLADLLKPLADQPVRYLVNTHHHADHTGGNAGLAQAGIPVIAHEAIRPRVAADLAADKASLAWGLPTVLLKDDASGKASLDLQVGGTLLQVRHDGPGHTDGDLVVHVPSARVVHVGDLMFRGVIPYIQVDAGGSLEGLIAQLERLAASLPGDVRIIQGHGPLSGKPDLLRHLAMLKAVREHVRNHPALDPEALEAGFDKQPWIGELVPNPPYNTLENLFRSARGLPPNLRTPSSP